MTGAIGPPTVVIETIAPREVVIGHGVRLTRRTRCRRRIQRPWWRTRSSLLRRRDRFVRLRPRLRRPYRLRPRQAIAAEDAWERPMTQTPARRTAGAREIGRVETKMRRVSQPQRSKLLRRFLLRRRFGRHRPPHRGTRNRTANPAAIATKRPRPLQPRRPRPPRRLRSLRRRIVRAAFIRAEAAASNRSRARVACDPSASRC